MLKSFLLSSAPAVVRQVGSQVRASSGWNISTKLGLNKLVSHERFIDLSVKF